MSTLSSLVAPNAASPSSSSTRISASWPRRTRGRGPALAGALAEERVHDVGEREALALPERRRRRAQRVAAEVVHLALLRVAQHVVGARDLLEALLRRLVGVDVGVQLAGQRAVGLLDLLGARVARDAEDFVESCVMLRRF